MNLETNKPLSETTCSAYISAGNGSCKHGHSILLPAACMTPRYKGTYNVLPTCVSENFMFDAARQVVTLRRFK